ncbi:MAG: glycosyltransferase [Candidatus Aureabacteria bacterium]|nr:glycosyltransferase [Candidatus Auribacterota bacterium]
MKKEPSAITPKLVADQALRISVIIPAFNAENDIADCVKLLLDSDYKNFEILIVDDCSCDRTAERVRDLPCKILKTNHRSGPAGAREMGIRNAKGEMLVFIDSDILVQKNTLRRLLESFCEKPGVASVSGDYATNGTCHNLCSLYQKTYNEYKRIFLPPCGPYINTSIYCIPREIMQSIGGFRSDIYTGEDYELGLRLAGKGYINYFNRSIRVTHNKRVTLAQLIRQKFQYATNVTMLKLEFERTGHDHRIDLKQTFSVAIDQIIAAALPWPLIIAGCASLLFPMPLFRWLALGLLLGYCASSMRYWLFLFKSTGITAVLFIPISFLEHAISGLSVIIGVIRFWLHLPYWKFKGIP